MLTWSSQLDWQMGLVAYKMSLFQTFYNCFELLACLDELVLQDDTAMMIG
jgi:hypothetical protein